MAPQPPAESTLETLIARLAASRTELGHHAAGIRERIDVPKRIQRSVTDSIRSHPLVLFGGTLGLGFIASRIFRRSKPAKSQASTGSGIKGLVLTTAIALIKPALIRFVTQELQRRFLPSSTPREQKETRFPLPKN
ncbi:MAG: hypothetical protein MUF31_10820 [Akkermansiaceae bacterium]|nr:hypothetical protein [Akkermansiaceae bacterium]